MKVLQDVRKLAEAGWGKGESGKGEIGKAEMRKEEISERSGSFLLISVVTVVVPAI